MKNKIINITLLALCFTLVQVNSFAQKEKKIKRNVLFIAVDDLKPILGCYGNTLVKTPNIDRLAKMGTVFMKNYCQQAVCGPTRASLMTGKRPDYTKVWDLKTRMRDMNSDIVSIPQYFISQGYAAAGVGKIYHPACVDKNDEQYSWTMPYLKPKDADYANGLGKPAKSQYQSEENKALIAQKNNKEDKGEKDEDGETGGKKKGPSSECIDVPDNAYEDGVTALLAKEQLMQFSKSTTPFFMAVGFHKPHLPFVAPKKYWDLYNKNDMPIAEFQEHSKDGPLVAYHSSSELRNYTDIPEFATLPKDGNRIGLKLEKQKELIQGYYAAISFMDAQVGILLNTLQDLGMLENTVIVLWGDHGWHLGDHDLWEKHTNFENAARAPLIFAAPGFKAGQTNSLTEHVDIFPTLCELSGLSIPTYLDGKSLAPIMKNNKAQIKNYAVSQYPRKLKAEELKKMGYADKNLMGYTLRTDKYRFTAWMNNSFRANVDGYSAERVYATELYDYEKDALETKNFTNDAAYKTIKKDLEAKLIEFFKSQLSKK
jgi:arylsulfatase A-like enzyme